MDGKKKSSSENIVELSFNGGLHGKVSEAGDPVELGFMFVKDRFVTLQISNRDQVIRLPWDQIASVQGMNGGFKNTVRARE